MTAPLSRMASKKRQNLKNRDARLAYMRRYYQENKEKLRARRRVRHV